jgi:NhaP-type Na+/H+ or K+/H+ antiporter
MVPIVTVFLAIAATETGASGDNWGLFATRQIGFGILAGVVVGVLGGWLLHRFASAGFVDGIYRQLATIAIAAAAFTSAGVVGGNGFIAAFVAGLAFSHVAREECKNVQDFTEDEGELLGSITFLVFGAVLAAPVLGSLTWQIALYIVLSLTVVRMLPVLIALARSRTRFETRLFIGWFGPRGLASILFALLVFDELSGAVADTVFSVAVWTILVSVFAHGITASSWTSRLARRLEDAPASALEMVAVDEMPTRRRL